MKLHALVGVAGLAIIAFAPGAKAFVPWVADSSIGTVGIGSREALPLSDEQRSWIFLGVMNLPDVPEVAVPAPSRRLRAPSNTVAKF